MISTPGWYREPPCIRQPGRNSGLCRLRSSARYVKCAPAAPSVVCLILAMWAWTRGSTGCSGHGGARCVGWWAQLCCWAGVGAGSPLARWPFDPPSDPSADALSASSSHMGSSTTTSLCNHSISTPVLTDSPCGPLTPRHVLFLLYDFILRKLRGPGPMARPDV